MSRSLGRICHEEIVAFFKVVFQNLSRGTEENHTEPLNGKPVVEILSLNSIKISHLLTINSVSRRRVSFLV